MTIKPYPGKDWTVRNNRDIWHYCQKPWIGQCKDHHNLPSNDAAWIQQWSETEAKRESDKRAKWYKMQKELSKGVK